MEPGKQPQPVVQEQALVKRRPHFLGPCFPPSFFLPFLAEGTCYVKGMRERGCLASQVHSKALKCVSSGLPVTPPQGASCLPVKTQVPPPSTRSGLALCPGAPPGPVTAQTGPLVLEKCRGATLSDCPLPGCASLPCRIPVLHPSLAYRSACLPCQSQPFELY